MITKKNMVKQVLMSTLTASIFTFCFTACSNDDLTESSIVRETDQKCDAPLLEAYGLSFYDYDSGDDVQILNADTTQISVSKALADRLGIKSFVGHPMGIWQGPAQRAFLRRATEEKLVGDNYILNVIPSSIAEIMVGQKEEVKLSTEIFVNTDMQAVRSRAESENLPTYVTRYMDDNNVMHPMAVTINPGDEASQTRFAEDDNIYGTYLPEQLLGMDPPETRGFFDWIKNAVSSAANTVADWFRQTAIDFGSWIKKQTSYSISWNKVDNTLINIDTKLEKKIPIEINKNRGDTINVYVKVPMKFNLNYNLILRADGSLVQLPRLNEFEASVAGRFCFEPEVRVGFGGKLELPEDKQKVKLYEFTSYTVTFSIGPVPFTVDICPNLFLKFEAEAGGRATMGVKYEFDSWFKAGVRYSGGFRGIAEGDITKSEFSFIPPTAEFNAHAGIGLMLGCDFIIDKLAGPGIAMGPKLTADADLKIAPFSEKPVDFNASVDLGVVGEASAKLKIWKWDIAEWNTDLDFGLNRNIFKYPSDNPSENVLKNIESMQKNFEKLISDKKR